MGPQQDHAGRHRVGIRLLRATIYRLFPGGKDALFGALVQREVSAFFDHVALRLNATESLEERLREGITAALEQIWSHPALRFLVEHEPNAVVRNPVTAGLHQSWRSPPASSSRTSRITCPPLGRGPPPIGWSA